MISRCLYKIKSWICKINLLTCTLFLIQIILSILLFYSIAIVINSGQWIQNISKKVQHNAYTNYTTSSAFVSELYVPGFIYDNKELCSNRQAISLLVIVFSKPEAVSQRIGIRLTWGIYNNMDDVAIAFLIGVEQNKKTNFLLSAEMEIFNDIIRCSNVDSYGNLTLKSLCMMEWISTNCPNAKFVLKTDDDMFINIPQILLYITRLNKHDRFIYGVSGGKKVIRYRSKYRVTTDEYSFESYPHFCNGPAYLFPAHLSNEIFLKSLNYRFFKLEDVFITGIVAHGLGIGIVGNTRFLNILFDQSLCNTHYTITIRNISIHNIHEVWSKFLIANQKRCRYFIGEAHLYPRPNTNYTNTTILYRKIMDLNYVLYNRKSNLYLPQCKNLSHYHNRKLVNYSAKISNYNYVEIYRYFSYTKIYSKEKYT